jgi:hypothetical protein
MPRATLTLPFTAATTSGGFSSEIVNTFSEGLLAKSRADLNQSQRLDGATAQQMRSLEALRGNDPSVAQTLYVPVFREVLSSDLAIQGGRGFQILGDGTVGSMPQPVGYWKLNETGGAVPVASVGSSVGAAVGSTVVQGAAGMLTGQAGTAYTFPGGSVNSFADLNTAGVGIGALTPHTISFWMRPAGTASGTILNKRASSTGAGWSVNQTPAGILYRRSDGTTLSDNSYTYAVTPGTRQHVCIVFTGSVGTQSPWYAANNTSILFLDGVEVQRVAHTTLPAGIGANALPLTAALSSDHVSSTAFVGDLQEVAIWSGTSIQNALSPDQVFHLNQSGLYSYTP